MKTDAIREYLTASGWLENIKGICSIAAGEYNENYRIDTDDKTYVFRINHGSQLFIENQIEYEFNVLKVLENSGVTPAAYFYDNSPHGFAGGVLLMDFIEGGPLDYRKDSERAALIFSRIHNAPAEGPLIRQVNPVQDICDESLKLIGLADSGKYDRLKPVLLRYHGKMLELSEESRSIFSDENLCIVNTEVNSGNFIMSEDSAFLVDWEKAVISCRYQDLGHFLIPTTTLWKSDFTFTEEARKDFLSHYISLTDADISPDEADFKTRILERVILLRALSWCYMAWGRYTEGTHKLMHDDTFRKIKQYLDCAECFLK